jgi:hypothetical protein
VEERTWARAFPERGSDATGAVLPGVTVTATNLQTRVPRSAVTDGTGFYTFPNLQPGRYEVTAELEGFKKHVQSDVQLDAAGSLVLEFTLETGALTEAITVTAESTPLQSDVAVRKTVESKDIEQMALNGRNPIGVAGLKAGVPAASTSTAAAPTKTTSRSMARPPSVHGPRAISSGSRTWTLSRRCRC